MNVVKRLLPLAFATGTLLFLAIGPAFSQTSDLFFSEYVEGSSNNKALEIYNGTGGAVNLAEYVVELYSNGATTPGNSLTLSDAAATLAHGDVLVIANASADPAILNAADITSTVTFFNGDDAVALTHNGVIIDVIGVIGSRPSGEWGTGDESTAENSIRRLSTVCAGDANGFDNPGDISDQWVGFPQNTFDGLGLHLADCGGGPVNLPLSLNCGSALETTEGIAASTSVSASDPDGVIADISITGINPVPAAGSISASALSGDAVWVSVSADVPAGSYQVSLSAINNDPSPQSDSCLLTINVAAGFTGWVINEIHADPASNISGDANGDGVRDSGQDEFVELVNTTGATVDISGWSLSDAVGVRHLFPNGTLIKNTAAIVVFGGGTPTGTFGDATVQVASTGTLGLNNGGDRVTLANAGLVMAEESYGSEGGSDQSLTREPDLTGGFVRHTTAVDAAGARFSPGTRINGEPFLVPGAEDLFFSEYIEGSSNNKAIEIYNGTGGPVDLSEYRVTLYPNGTTTPGNSLLLSDAAPTLANNDVLVIANASSVAEILNVADITSTVTFFNGDDALVLTRNDVVIDMLGIVGNRPAGEWGTGSVTTKDHSIRRLSSVCAGDADGFDDPTDLTNQWEGFAINTFDGLGSHQANCGGQPANQPVAINCGDDALLTIAGYSASNNITAEDPDGNVTSFVISSINPGPGTGSITLSDLVTGALASATVTVSATLPAGTYTVEIIAVNDDAQPQSASCSLTVEVVSPVSIASIQGSGDVSPYQDLNAATTGVVTALTSNGFFIQTPDSEVDGDPNTSEGLYVFTGAAPTAQIGEEVAVVGGVVEYFGLTEFSGNVNYYVLSSDNPLPTAVVLDANTPSPVFREMERFESALVTVPNGLALAGTDRFGDTYMTAGSSRIFREPGIIAPGLPGLPVWDGNPEIFEVNPDGVGLPNLDIIGGSTIQATGPVTYSFGDYQILPTSLSVTPPALFPIPVRDRVDEVEFTVGSMNCLRLFFNQPDEAGFADRLQKLSLQIRTVMGSPDIIAFEEVAGIEVLEALAARVQADDSNLIYTAHLATSNDIGGIDTGFLARDTVQVNGLYQYRKDATFQLPDGRIIPLHDRPPLVLDAVYTAGHLPFPISVLVVHNRSYVGSEDPEDGDWIRSKRYNQALEIGQVINDLQTANPDIHLVVTGDFNAYEFTDGFVDSLGLITGYLDPLGALEPGVDVVDPDMTNQTFLAPLDQRYSFIFGGSSQALDHMLTSSRLTARQVEVQFGRNNADAPLRDANIATTASRASDHDPVVLFVMSERDSDGDGLPDDEDSCPHSDTNPVVVIDGCDSGVPNILLDNGCTILDLINDCIANNNNHGQRQSCIAHLLNDLKKDGYITGAQKGAITSCAAKATDQ